MSNGGNRASRRFFGRDYFAFIKLRFNSAHSVAHCKGISSLINAPKNGAFSMLQKTAHLRCSKKRRIFDAPKNGASSICEAMFLNCSLIFCGE
jgi:hypothetical protein